MEGNEIDRMLALIESLAEAMGKLTKSVDRLEARVRELERQVKIQRGAYYTGKASAMNDSGTSDRNWSKVIPDGPKGF